MTLLQESGLEERLISMSSNMTVFAPTNDAFDQLESSFVENLMVDSESRDKVSGEKCIKRDLSNCLKI